MDPITVAIVNLVIGLVISGVTTLAQQAFAPKPQAQKQLPGMRGQYSTGGTVPMSIVIGTYGVAGQLEYSNTWGNDGETPNAFLVDVISLSDYPITAVTAQWIDTIEVTLPGSGSLPRGLAIEEPDKFDGYAWYRHYDGSQTVADAYLLDKFGGDSKRPWLSDMVGEGLSYSINSARINEQLWTDFPRYMYEVQGAPLFDPRLSTAVGGSGSQVWGTFSTYAFSDNLAVLALNVLLGIHDPDGNHIWGGRATLAQFDYINLAAAMDRCDDDIPKAAGGTEKRYRGGIEISLNERPADVLRDIMVAANMRISYARGKYWFLVDEPDAADASFTDGDLLTKEPIDFSWFPDLDSAVNGATATFLARQRAWEERETKPYYRADLEAEDHDQKNREKLQLRCVFSGSQAQRIIKAVVEQSRKFKRHVVCLPDTYRNYRPLQCLAWTSDEFQYSSKLFLIISRTEDEFGNIWFALQEIDPADFDWDAETDEAELTFASTEESPVPVQGADDFDAEGTVFVDNDGVSRRAGIQVSFAPDLDDVRAVRVQVVLDGSADVAFEGDVPYDPAAVDNILLPKEFLPATNYEARGRYIPRDGSGRDTSWSTFVALTTPDVRLGPDDFYPIDLTMLASDVAAWQQRAANSIREVKDTLARFDQLVADTVARGVLDRKTLREELAATSGDLTASYKRDVDLIVAQNAIIAQRTEKLEVTFSDVATVTITDALQAQITTNGSDITALGSRVTTVESTVNNPTTGVAATASAVSTLQTTVNDGTTGVNASATAITALQTQLGNSGSSATIRMDTSASPSAGFDSAIAIQTAVSAGGTMVANGMYFESKSAGNVRRIVVDTDQFVVRAGGTVAALFDAGTTYIANARLTNLVASWAQISSAVVGNFVADTANIGDLKVTTLKIANNAVSTIDSAFTATNTTYTSETTVQTLSFTPANGKVMVKMSVGVTISGSDSSITVRMKRAGTLVSAQVVKCSSNISQTVTIFYIDTSPGTSAISWTLTCDVTSGSGTGNANQRYIECQNQLK